MGGNIGDTLRSMEQAIGLLEKECGNSQRLSSVYKTAPWGKTDQQSFLNQALLLETKQSPDSLMTKILRIEETMGRRRDEKFGPRLIDIDILLFNEEVIDTDLVTIPHPQLPYRRFALVPLAEIAGEVIHPILKKSINDVLRECSDELEVVVYK